MDEKMPSREDFLLVQKTAEEIGRLIFNSILEKAKKYKEYPTETDAISEHEKFGLAADIVDEIKGFLALDKFAEGAAAMARNAEE